jgi:hypothetical protein
MVVSIRGAPSSQLPVTLGGLAISAALHDKHQSLVKWVARGEDLPWPGAASRRSPLAHAFPAHYGGPQCYVPQSR